MNDKKPDSIGERPVRTSDSTVYVVCGRIFADMMSDKFCRAKDGSHSGHINCAFCGTKVCPQKVVLLTPHQPVQSEHGANFFHDAAVPVRDTVDLYRRCYKRWGLYTDEVNDLLGVKNMFDITNPQAAWDDILRFRMAEMNG